VDIVVPSEVTKEFAKAPAAGFIFDFTPEAQQIVPQRNVTFTFIGSIQPANHRLSHNIRLQV
jgi:hypothetical protein